MRGKTIQDPEQIREILDVSAKRNNNLLIFFFSFGLYILISTLGTTDVALLLPKEGFKMPMIEFELDLLNFFILGPFLLLLLHFNLLFGHHKHLEKLHTYKNKVNIHSIDPSLYNFAFMMGNRGFSGRIINIILWILLYFLPLLLFLIIYIRFADYHHKVITPLHLAIIIVDLIFIISSIRYNDIFYKSMHADHSPIKITTILKYLLKYLVYFFMICIGVLSVLYYLVFFRPIVNNDYDPLYLKKVKNDCLPKLICSSMNLIYKQKEYCYPRLIVTEEEMAKISKSALYLPRFLAMGEKEKYKNMTTKDKDRELILKERELILKYGTRIDLKDRDLRYADLESSILTRADIRNSKFDAANLAKSHMQAVKLDNASFIDAILIQAKLQSVDFIGNDLSGTNLVGANMNHATFDTCNLTGAFLQTAQLKRSEFFTPFIPTNTTTTNNLTSADLREANLMGANLMGANLTNADLMAANLIGANLSAVDLTGASLQGANITGTVFDDANLTAVDLSDVYFRVTLDKMGNDILLQGFPSFKETKIIGINISKYKKQDSNSTKKQNTILFDVNTSIYPVVFEVNTLERYSNIDEDISKFPKLFDMNSSETYTLTLGMNYSEKPLFLVDVNISEENRIFHQIRIKYLEAVIKKIESQDKSQEKLKKLKKKLKEILKASQEEQKKLKASPSENVKNKDLNNSKYDIEKCLKNKFIDLYKQKVY